MQAGAEQYYQGICWEGFPLASARWTEWISQFTLVNKLDSIWLRDEFHSQQGNSAPISLYTIYLSLTVRTFCFFHWLVNREKVCCASRKLPTFPAFPGSYFPTSPGLRGKAVLSSSGAFPACLRGERGAKEKFLQFKAFVLQISLTGAWLCKSY